LAFMNPWLSGMHWTARQRRWGPPLVYPTWITTQ
jgi:hypothetical protein